MKNTIKTLALVALAATALTGRGYAQDDSDVLLSFYSSPNSEYTYATSPATASDFGFPLSDLASTTVYDINIGPAGTQLASKLNPYPDGPTTSNAINPPYVTSPAPVYPTGQTSLTSSPSGLTLYSPSANPTPTGSPYDYSANAYTYVINGPGVFNTSLLAKQLQLTGLSSLLNPDTRYLLDLYASDVDFSAYPNNVSLTVGYTFGTNSGSFSESPGKIQYTNYAPGVFGFYFTTPSSVPDALTITLSSPNGGAGLSGLAITTTPEPSTWAMGLIAFGVLAVVEVRRRAMLQA